MPILAYSRNISGITGKYQGQDFRPLTLAQYWQQATQGDWDGFIDWVVRRGHPWCAAQLSGNRAKANVKSAGLIGIDIDHGMTVAEAIAHPLVSAHAALIYPSPSHQLPGKGDRFRIVFRLPRSLSDVAAYEAIVSRLITEIGAADPSTKDASRLWYGARPGSEPLYFAPEACLPESWIASAEQAIAAAEQKQLELAAKAKARRNQQRLSKPAGFGAIATIPLEICLSQAERDTLAGLAPQGTRNNAVMVLYRSAQGAADWLRAEGYSVDGDPESYAWEAGRGCGLPEREIATLIKANSGSHRPSVPDQALLNCVMAYRWREGDRTGDVMAHIKSKSTSHRDRPVVLPTAPWGRTYERGQRLATWIANPKQIILDRSATGLGKGHDAGLTEPEMFGAIDAYFVSNEHRNPTTSTLMEGWEDVPARHDGIVHHRAPDGSTIARRRHDDEAYSEAPNCSRIATISALNAKNIPAYSADVICPKCPHLEACRNGSGPDYGFLSERKAALAATRKRIHPLSLPSEEALADSVVLIDEPDRMAIYSSVGVLAADVASVRGLPELDAYPKLRAVLGTLHGLLTGDLPYHGLDHHATIEKLGTLTLDADVDELMAALTPDVDAAIDPDGEHGVSLSDLPQAARERMAVSDSATAMRISKSIPKQWLREFVAAITGEAGYTLSVSAFGALTLTWPSLSHLRRLLAAKKVIFTSATMQPAQLAAILGVPESEIDVVAERQPPQRTKIIQITGMGRVHRQRTEAQIKRVAAVAAAIDPDITIDFLGHDADAAWWRDTVGTNTLANASKILAVGTPIANLAALQAHHAAIFGIIPKLDSPEFGAIVDAAIACEYQQAMGRKANRRGRDGDVLYVLSDWEGLQAVATSQGFAFEQVKATALTPEAAGKGEATTRAIVQHLWQAITQGKAPKLGDLATAVGITTGRVSQILGSLFGEGFCALKKSLVFLYKQTIEKLNFSPEAQLLATQLAEMGIRFAEMPPDEERGRVIRIWRSHLTQFSKVCGLEATTAGLIHAINGGLNADFLAALLQPDWDEGSGCST